jgi:hypothetical protein
MVGNVTCALFYQGGHGLLSIDNIDVRALTTALFGFLDIRGRAPESLGLEEPGNSPRPFLYRAQFKRAWQDWRAGTQPGRSASSTTRKATRMLERGPMRFQVRGLYDMHLSVESQCS